ncbi:MAG: UDP-N-acetylenolpyruvoylglucosamine reductase, partial [Alphaproteobacteria bacterium]|nr:UDP-N-acetylenolpyruvoylglucosamine reductase [Alphaproteobacteria bacterium]
ELVDQAGFRGVKKGGAEVSPLHTNFLIAHEGAKASDIEALGEEIRSRVFEQSGIRLEWEIKRVGEP